jgi:hypothetical protein
LGDLRVHQNEHHLQKYLAGVGGKIMQATARTACGRKKGRPNRWAARAWRDRNSVVNERARHMTSKIFSSSARRFSPMSGYPPTAAVAASVTAYGIYLAAEAVVQLK